MFFVESDLDLVGKIIISACWKDSKRVKVHMLHVADPASFPHTICYLGITMYSPDNFP